MTPRPQLTDARKLPGGRYDITICEDFYPAFGENAAPDPQWYTARMRAQSANVQEERYERSQDAAALLAAVERWTRRIEREMGASPPTTDAHDALEMCAAAMRGLGDVDTPSWWDALEMADKALGRCA